MLSPSTRLWYGLGQVAEGIKNHSFTTFLLFYYTQVHGLSGTLASLALGIALLFDAVSDPLAGVLSDRTESRWGRRHPFMYASALPLAIFFYFSFAPPAGLSQLALFGWLLLFAVATRAAMTLYHVPHMALGAELSTEYNERTRIVMSRAIFGSLGGYLAGGFGLLYFMRPTAAYPNGQLNPGAYPPFAAIFAVVMAVAIIASAIGTHRRIPFLPRADATARSSRVFTSLGRDTRAILRIPAFRALFFGTTLIFVAFGVGGVLGLHLGTYFWRVTMTQLFYWGVGAGTGTFVGMFFWARVAARIDKKPTFLLGLALFLFFAAVPILCKVVGFWPAEESPLYLPFYIAAGVLYSFAIAAPTVTGTSMMADVADEDELESGRRREGVFFGASAFAAKAAVAGGQLIAGPLLDLAAIQPGADPSAVPIDAADTLALATGGALLLLVGAAILAFSRYDLDRSRHAEIQRTLRERASAA